MTASAPLEKPGEPFHPAVQEWFETRFPEGPTGAQARGWPSIQAAEDTLIAAPTGSGKTLAAFLAHIDRLYREAQSGPLPEGVDVVYVSPLKALVLDIQQNLEQPLREIAAIAERRGFVVPSIRVAMRSGDTPAGQRAQLLKTPPHFLITTPESLFLMVTAEKSRALLTRVRAVIVDEIHALARDKRGVHLSLTLERLAALCERRPTRIGLSATQRPLPRIARLLVGNERTLPNGEVRCEIVDEGHRRRLDLSLALANRELEAVASTEQLGEVTDHIAEQVRGHKTTLVFVNTRRLAERLGHLLAERLGEGQVAAHHGSLSKERRLRVENQLRAGELRALVATASLELGIDVGPVELVCQLGSPRSIATFLQRVGRSGHTRFATPKGILYPLTRDELIECTALLRAVNAGELDEIVFPDAPLDILAQQLVAECGAESWQEDELFALVRRAAPYRDLQRADHDAVVNLLSEGIVTGRGRRAAYLHRDRVQRRVRGRRGARLAALTSGGAIPETADYRVIQEPNDTFVGTVNEDFAIESMAGDVFLLGSTSWRIRRVGLGVVRVVDAQGAAPSVPFWLGEAPARTRELSEQVSALRADVERHLANDREHALRFLVEECCLDARSSAALTDYLTAARDALGLLPTRENMVFERFFDETGGMQLVVHSPFGGRINRALGLLLRKRFCRSFDFELQAAANDDAIVLSLGPQHSFPLSDLLDFLRPAGVEEALRHAVLVTPMFQARWRWNLNRSLIVLRQKGGRKNPPQFQRMEADDVMAAVFPSLAACQDNATGPREIPEHPIVDQTLHDCLHEAMDVAGLLQLLHRVADGTVRVHFRDTTEPSPLTHEILNGRPYTFLDDAPLEERRTRAVQLRRGLPLEAKDLSALDPSAIERVIREATPDPRDAEELHDLLCELIAVTPRASWQPWLEELRDARRAFEVKRSEQTMWAAAERLHAVRALFPEAEIPGEDSSVDVTPEPIDRDAVLCELVRGQLEQVGPVGVAALATSTGLSHSDVQLALAQLEQDGFALRGRFDLSQGAEQYCSRRLLSRIHGYTQQRLRREIEPVSAQDFLRFLLDFHGVTRDFRRRGPQATQRTVEQLQGFETAAAAWEGELLTARVNGFEAEFLDALCWSGEVTWGRLSPRSVQTEQAWASFSRTTPITLMVRDDFPWLLQAVRHRAGATPPDAGPARAVLDALGERGALFFTDLERRTGLSASDVDDALWDGVARGLITSDGFSALRNLLKPRAASPPAWSFRGSLRRAAQAGRPREGRWALIPTAERTFDSDQLAEAVAEQLLARYGVVFRDLLERESFTLPWREIVWALRRLEARGLIRGGRFVTGFVGEQYALPEAVDGLRQTRRRPPSGEVVRLSACDPLNLVGIIVPGTRVPAQRGNWVTYRDGAVVPTELDARSELRGVPSTDN